MTTTHTDTPPIIDQSTEDIITMYIPPITSSKEDVITTYADIPPIIDQSQEDIIKKEKWKIFYIYTHTPIKILSPLPRPSLPTYRVTGINTTGPQTNEDVSIETRHLTGTRGRAEREPALFL